MTRDAHDDFGGEAVLHIEVDGEPVHFGHPNTPANGNIGASPTQETVEFEAGGQTVTVDVVAFVDDQEGGV